MRLTAGCTLHSIHIIPFYQFYQIPQTRVFFYGQGRSQIEDSAAASSKQCIARSDKVECWFDLLLVIDSQTRIVHNNNYSHFTHSMWAVALIAIELEKGQKNRCQDWILRTHLLFVAMCQDVMAAKLYWQRSEDNFDRLGAPTRQSIIFFVAMVSAYHVRIYQYCAKGDRLLLSYRINSTFT